METYSDGPFRRFYLQEGIVRYRRVSKDTKELQKIQKSFKRYERVSKDTEEFQKIRTGIAEDMKCGRG